jgi:uncharacterized protein (DUF983 family)
MCCKNPRCEHGWIYNGPLIGYIPCEDCDKDSKNINTNIVGMSTVSPKS